ncbi:MAG: HAMP domain-containing protein [Bdellovibrionales bacterium]|nr:HAMP domain-containing protein [Bdellovibrionales bacterium]
MKISFATKVWISIAILSVGIACSSVTYLYSQSKALLLNQMGSRLADVGRTAVEFFGPEERELLKRLRDEAQKLSSPFALVTQGMEAGEYRSSIADEQANQIMEGDDFKTIVELLRRIKGNTLANHAHINGRPAIRYATVLVAVPEDRTMRIMRFLADADYDDPTVPNPFGTLLYGNSDALTAALHGHVAADSDFRRENGQYLLSAGIPIPGEDGTPIGILALDYDAESEANSVRRLLYWSISVVVGSFVLSVLLAVLISRMLNRPIEILRAGAERVRNKDFSTRVEVETDDELGLLASAFNSMVEEIGRYSSDLEQINSSLARFVPTEFLQQLGQASITEVALGDHVQKQMTVLFSDIRSFSTITEYMSPRDSFDLVNDYLRAVSPIIRRHGGFIDKFIGDAIMALFPDGPETAVAAAVEMQQALRPFNEEGHDLGRPMIQVGIGIHHGNMMLGTVGESERMEGTVIADAVNLASRLESLTKEYRAGIIASERVARSIAGSEDVFSRYLGVVKVKGKQTAVDIYELFPNQNNDETRIRIVSRKDFERAVRAVEKNDIAEALEMLEEILERNPTDGTAQYFLERCRAAPLRLDYGGGSEELEQ